MVRASHRPADDSCPHLPRADIRWPTRLRQAVFHVVLDADEDMLRQRIHGSGEAQAWRLAHLAEYRSSRSWMVAAADLVVDTGGQTPCAAAHQFAEALPGL